MRLSSRRPGPSAPGDAPLLTDRHCSVRRHPRIQQRNDPLHFPAKKAPRVTDWKTEATAADGLRAWLERTPKARGLKRDNLVDAGFNKHLLKG